MRPVAFTMIVSLFIALPAWTDGRQEHHGGMGQTAETTRLADGEVRRVDRAQGRLTLRHGPIESLDMPPMTMVFRVQDASLLDGIKAGDRVRFEAQRIDGAYVVTRLEKSR